jgi:hypothetical protein
MRNTRRAIWFFMTKVHSDMITVVKKFGASIVQPAAYPAP